MFSDEEKKKILKALGMDQVVIYIHVWECNDSGAMFSHEQFPFSVSEQESISKYNEEYSKSWKYKHTMVMNQTDGSFKSINIEDVIQDIDSKSNTHQVSDDAYGTDEDQVRRYYNSTRGV